MTNGLIGSYLRTHRKKWGLSQRELGLLLGISKQAVSRYELERQPVSAQLLIASKFVFGEPFTSMFPAVCMEIEDEISRRAVTLDVALRGHTDPQSIKKLKLLSMMSDRVTSTDA